MAFRLTRSLEVGQFCCMFGKNRCRGPFETKWRPPNENICLGSRGRDAVSLSRFRAGFLIPLCTRFLTIPVA